MDVTPYEAERAIRWTQRYQVCVDLVAPGGRRFRYPLTNLKDSKAGCGRALKRLQRSYRDCFVADVLTAMEAH